MFSNETDKRTAGDLKISIVYYTSLALKVTK